MGNTLTCCLRASPSPRASPKLGRRSRQVKSKCKYEVREEAARDTGAVETVPATLKSEKLRSERLISLALRGYNRRNISAPVSPQDQDKRKNNDEWPAHLGKRYRSCPTVFLPDDALRQPDLKTTIQSMSLTIYYIIKHRVQDRTLHIFDEIRHPFRHERNTQARSLQNPELHVVYRFVCDLFSAEHLTAECVVVTLIFVERLLDYRNMDLCPTNWRRILVGSALLAYEYWNKQAVWSMDYCQVINNIITAEDMNEIEMHFLHSIRFDIKITSYMYARYYFDLLDMAEANNVVDLFEPFLQSRALNPEAISRCYQEKDLGRAAIKRSLSADNLLAQATHQIHAL